MRVHQDGELLTGNYIRLKDVNPNMLELVYYRGKEAHFISEVSVEEIKRGKTCINITRFVNSQIGSEEEWYMSKEAYETIYGKM